MTKILYTLCATTYKHPDKENRTMNLLNTHRSVIAPRYPSSKFYEKKKKARAKTLCGEILSAFLRARNSERVRFCSPASMTEMAKA